MSTEEDVWISFQMCMIEKLYKLCLFAGLKRRPWEVANDSQQTNINLRALGGHQDNVIFVSKDSIELSTPKTANTSVLK